MRLLLLISIFAISTARAASRDSTELLIADMIVQIEATEAMNAMYNFDFEEAGKQYHWLMQKHPESPLAYFLLGLNEWWKMMPDTDVEDFDGRFHYYMDTAIVISKGMLKIDSKRIEGAFFLAAAYGFKGRLYSDRGKWGKAASAGRSSLKYLEICEEHSYLSPELLFGDALYNYFSVWIPENYPILKPILAFFPDGDKKLGLKQLNEVARNAFYTRIEAQIFLMQILANDAHDYTKSLAIAEYLHTHYENNPYFHRYYIRYLYSTHQYKRMEPKALEILARIDSGRFGYEATAGRYAAFFLGQANQSWGNEKKAKQYYLKAVEFAKQQEMMETGYCLYSLLNLGKIARKDNRKKEANDYFKLVKKNASRKQNVYKEAKKYLKAK